MYVFCDVFVVVVDCVVVVVCVGDCGFVFVGDGVDYVEFE